jgi:hypothetical protein
MKNSKYLSLEEVSWTSKQQKKTDLAFKSSTHDGLNIFHAINFSNRLKIQEEYLQKQIDTLTQQALLNKSELVDPNNHDLNKNFEKLKKLKEFALYNESCRNELIKLRYLHGKRSSTGARLNDHKRVSITNRNHNTKQSSNKYSTYNADSRKLQAIATKKMADGANECANKCKTWPEAELRYTVDNDENSSVAAYPNDDINDPDDEVNEDFETLNSFFMKNISLRNNRVLSKSDSVDTAHTINNSQYLDTMVVFPVLVEF